MLNSTITPPRKWLAFNRFGTLWIYDPEISSIVEYFEDYLFTMLNESFIDGTFNDLSNLTYEEKQMIVNEINAEFEYHYYTIVYEDDDESILIDNVIRNCLYKKETIFRYIREMIFYYLTIFPDATEKFLISASEQGVTISEGYYWIYDKNVVYFEATIASWSERKEICYNPHMS